MKKILATMMVLILAMGMVFATTALSDNTGTNASTALDFTVTFSITEGGMVGFAKDSPVASLTESWAKAELTNNSNMTLPALVEDPAAMTKAASNGEITFDKVYLYAGYRGTNTTPKIKLATSGPIADSKGNDTSTKITYVVKIGKLIGDIAGTQFTVNADDGGSTLKKDGTEILTLVNLGSVKNVYAGTCSVQVVTEDLSSLLSTGTYDVNGNYKTTLTASFVTQ